MPTKRNLNVDAVFTGDPNGVVAGTLNQLGKSKDTGALWRCTGTGTAWVQITGGAGVTDQAIWSPGVTDAPPIYGTLAAALTAVKSQPGPGVVLMHPTTATAFATVASTTYDFDSRVSLYSINNRTLTFGNSAPLINPAEVGCLQDGFRLTLADGGSATGTSLLQINSNTLRPHVFNVTKSGTARRLVVFGGGTAAAERGIIIGRNVTTARTGDIWSDGATVITLRGHGHSFVSGVASDIGAHAEALEVIYENAQDQITVISSLWNGTVTNTFRQKHIKGTVTGLIGNEPTILTGTVTGAAVGDPVAISPDEPGGVANTGLTIQWVRVSATNTVKVCAVRSDTNATYTFDVVVMK